MEENKNVPAPIDLAKICKKLWAHRKTYFTTLPIVLVGTYLLTLCVPRYYSCEVSLAPESSGTSAAGGSLASLASSFGFGGLSKMGNDDAIYSEIYPELFKSNDFIARLMPVKIATQENNIECNYYTYLRDKQKSSPWDKAKGIVIELFNKTPKDTCSGDYQLNTFILSPQQNDIIDGAKGKVKCTVDKRTGIIIIKVQDQNPQVCAIIAKEACKELQKFITEYRTSKARVDFDYYDKLCKKAESDFENARINYASYSDGHQNVILESSKSKIERLRNEMQIKQEIYSNLNTQRQLALAKLQEATPAFTIIQNPSVPSKPEGPKRTLISLASTLISFIIMCLYLITKMSPAAKEL